MHKQLKNYAVINNMTIEEKNKIVYGCLNGFFVLISETPTMEHLVQLWVKEPKENPTWDIAGHVNQMISKYEYLDSANYQVGCLTAIFKAKGRKAKKEYMPCMEAFLKEITTYCQSYGFINCCETCGTEDGLDLYQIEGMGHMLCSACYTDFQTQVQGNKTRLKNRGNGNIVGGIIGAILGSLIGVAAWVIIYQLGYISSLAGLVMIVCAFKGFELLGGHLRVPGIIITCIICLVMLLVAEQTCVAIEIYKIFNEYGDISFFDAFKSVPEFMKESEVASAVISDLAVGYLLMILGIFGTVRQAIRASKGDVNSRRVTSVTPVAQENVKTSMTE